MSVVNARGRPKWRLDTGYALHIGGRDEQQDSAGVFPDAEGRGCLVVLADGMGGHRGGALASSTAVETMAKLWREHGGQPADLATFLEEGARRADEAVIEAGRSQGLEPRTTIVALVIMEDMAYWMHVGDSRLYCFRDGALHYRTRDHSLLESMVKAGEIAPEDVASHPDQNVLLRSIGSEEEDTLSITQNNLAVRPTDSFLLCSDGFWEVISESEMVTALGQNDLQESVQAWVNTAGQRQGEGGDNVSAACVRIERDTSEHARSAGPSRRATRAWAMASGVAALAVVGGAISLGGLGGFWPMDGESGSGPTRGADQEKSSGAEARKSTSGTGGTNDAEQPAKTNGGGQQESATATSDGGGGGTADSPDAEQEGEDGSKEGSAAPESQDGDGSGGSDASAEPAQKSVQGQPKSPAAGSATRDIGGADPEAAGAEKQNGGAVSPAEEAKDSRSGAGGPDTAGDQLKAGSDSPAGAPRDEHRVEESSVENSAPDEQMEEAPEGGTDD